MCSVKVSLLARDNSRDTELPTAPVDIALASHRDLLAVLDVHNTVSIWDLSNLITAGPRNGSLPFTPKPTWEGGIISERSQDGADGGISARQIVVWQCAPSAESDWGVAILASDPQSHEDVIHPLGKTITRSTVIHPGTVNGRLFVSTDNLWIQSTSGEILFGG